MTENPYMRMKDIKRADVDRLRRDIVGLKSWNNTLQEKLDHERECMETMTNVLQAKEDEITWLTDAVHDKDELLNAKDAEIKQADELLNQERKDKAMFAAEVRRLNMIINRLVGWSNE